MADRPINLHAHEINAIREGRQTQVRRVLKPQPPNNVTGVGRYGASSAPGFWKNSWSWLSGDQTDIDLVEFEGDFETPFIEGDRLWVRETFRGPYPYEYRKYPIRNWGNKAIWYSADGTPPHEFERQFWPKARPPIHMPRWASRLTLLVTDVRVQRLQEISRGDAIAEGIERVGGGILRWENWASGIDGVHGFSPEAAFALLWNSINAKRPGCAWDDDPFVVALTFRAIPKNIDQIGDGDDH